MIGTITGGLWGTGSTGSLILVLILWAKWKRISKAAGLVFDDVIDIVADWKDQNTKTDPTDAITRVERVVTRAKTPR